MLRFLLTGKSHKYHTLSSLLFVDRETVGAHRPEKIKLVTTTHRENCIINILSHTHADYQEHKKTQTSHTVQCFSHVFMKANCSYFLPFNFRFLE